MIGMCHHTRPLLTCNFHEVVTKLENPICIIPCEGVERGFYCVVGYFIVILKRTDNEQCFVYNLNRSWKGFPTVHSVSSSPLHADVS